VITRTNTVPNKGAMVIHVQYTHATRAAVMGSRWLGFGAVVTKGIVVKCTIPYSRVGSIKNICWLPGTFKSNENKCWERWYRQSRCCNRMENSASQADRKQDGICSPNPTTYHKEHKNCKNNDKTPVTETSQPKAFGFRSDWILIRDCTTPSTLKNRCIWWKNKV
jgi:hypothetical protein